MQHHIPTAQDLIAAHQRIKDYIHRTPILTNTFINELIGADLYFKCENFQKVGAFKARGGMNTVLSLTDEELRKGVATHSSGNHAQAIALAAKMAGAKAFIVMPSSAPKIKKAAVKDYGAEVIECDPTLIARETTLEKVVGATGATFIHPYDDYRVIAGQATAAKELIEDVTGKLDAIVTPVGGGGLLSGTALSAYYFSNGTKVFAGEPKGADDAYKSFTRGELIPQMNPKSVADGLLTSLGEKPFQIIMKYITDILLVTEAEIINAMRMVWERMKIIIEPSCAVPLAAVLRNSEQFKNQRIGIILTGGNVDLGKLPFE
ncbi:MAG: pyridoxal-phosphate dependent enzyme [Bacteroidota bacterium]